MAPKIDIPKLTDAIAEDVGEVIAYTLSAIAARTYDEDTALPLAEAIDRLTVRHAATLAITLNKAPSALVPHVRPVVSAVFDLALAAAPAAMDKFISRAKALR